MGPQLMLSQPIDMKQIAWWRFAHLHTMRVYGVDWASSMLLQVDKIQALIQAPVSAIATRQLHSCLRGIDKTVEGQLLESQATTLASFLTYSVPCSYGGSVGPIADNSYFYS